MSHIPAVKAEIIQAEAGVLADIVMTMDCALGAAAAVLAL